MGLNVGQSTRQTYSKLMHWTSGVYEESLAFVGLILSEMLTFIIWPITHQSHPLSSLVIIKVIFEPLLESWRCHVVGHVLPGWRPSKAISLPWIWSCMKPENWLKIDLSGEWFLGIALHTHSSAYYYWLECTMDWKRTNNAPNIAVGGSIVVTQFNLLKPNFYKTL